MNKNGHEILTVKVGSISEELEIEAGDRLLEINGEVVEDIFDYQFMVEEEYLEVLIQKQNGEEWVLEIEKEEEEDLGIEFANGLMDEYRTCTNRCIFCFIDQMPPGMRETLYFKDDDARLSFLQGNYITLTNMSDADVDRVVKYNLSPINISFQTTNPTLRCEMLHNRFAGDALLKVKKFYDAGILMNGQIVLCKGVNDREELERTLRDLYEYLPYLESVSVVPVGLSKYREGLYELEPFDKEDAIYLLEQIERYQEKAMKEHDLHFIHASDEWYILAEQEMPEEETYDGYLQIENGVGMVRSMVNEFEEHLDRVKEQLDSMGEEQVKRKISLVTGTLVAPYIKKMANQLEESFGNLSISVFPIRNDFFGEMITVSGLLTGQDILEQLKGKELGQCLFLPENVLRSGETVLLDDVTVGEMEKTLQVPIDIVKSSGYDFIHKMIGIS
ncbi:MAG: DUF512 domain-containing protein [Eubacteriales bacterium]